MAISKNDVFRIADEMFAEGTTPTLINLRTALGSGSFSTISTFLAEWKTTTRTGEVLNVSDVPQEITELFYPALASVWSKAVVLAAEKTAEAVEAAAIVEKGLKETAVDALALAEAVQAELTVSYNHALQLSAQIETLKENITILTHRNIALEAAEKEFRSMHSEFVKTLKTKNPPAKKLPAPAPFSSSPRQKFTKQGDLTD